MAAFMSIAWLLIFIWNAHLSWDMAAGAIGLGVKEKESGIYAE